MRVVIAISLLLFSFGLIAQPFGNEWIENEGYNKKYYKIRVTQDGIYRVSNSTLQAAGITGLAGDDLILYHDGEAVPIFTSTSGVFGGSDYFEFYGERNEGETEGDIYLDPLFQPHPYRSLFNDTAVYFLTLNNSPVNPGTKPRFDNIPNNITGVSAELYNWSTARRTWQNQFSLGKPTEIANANFYNSHFDEGEGFVSSDFGNCNCPGNLLTTLQTPGAYTAGPDAQINTVVIAKSSTNHQVQVRVNNTLRVDSSFNNYRMLRFNLPLSGAQVGNTVSVNVTAIAPGVDRNNMSLVEIRYPRQFDMDNESQSDFELPDAAGRRMMQFSNFNDRGAGVILYDLSNNYRVELNGSQGASFQIELPDASSERSIYMRSASSQDYFTVSNLEEITFINLENIGDYLIISHPRLFVDVDNDGIHEIEEYRRYRDIVSSSTGLFDARIIDIYQIYDQFGYGVVHHHRALPNFVSWALNEWNPAVRPQYMLLIGKGREYDDMRLNSSAYQGCIIPPYGYPGSDNLYTAVGADGTPQIPIGRISVDNASEVDIYLRKVEEYEANLSEFGDPYQTISNKAWMKEVLHFGGGTGQGEQNRFKSFLNSYARTLADTLYGGNVTSFFKTSTSPIQQIQSEALKSRVDSGVSMITFFGHSAPGTFDISFDDPENYTNFGKYPMVFSFGCFAGYIYNPGKGISERFLLADGKAGISFVSTTGLSLDVSLNNFAGRMYEKLSKDNYGQTLGQVLQATIADIFSGSFSVSDAYTTQEMTLNGDPALAMNQYNDPDYAIEASSIYFEPPILNAGLDSFKVNVVVSNLGKAIQDTIAVDITRLILSAVGGNNDLEYRRFVPAPNNKDTVTFTLPTLISGQGYGLNNFNISVEALRVIPELSESNNDLINVISKSIVSDDIFPVYPPEFAIVPTVPMTLKASTADPFARSNTYKVEIDTSELFNSPFLRTTSVTQSGGIVSWSPPATWIDSTVYYWRVSKDSAINGNYNWAYSSFIYIDGEFPGWNQSHYYQWLKDDYANIFVDSDREFKFVPDTKELDVTTGIADAVGGNLPYQQLAYDINGSNQHLFRMGGCGGLYGLVFAVIDPNSGLPIPSINNSGNNWGDEFGNYHCADKYFLQYGFDFRTTGSTPAGHPIGGRWSNVIKNFVDSIPNGHYVLVYSLNDPRYTSWDTTITNALLSLGAVDILQFTSGLSNPAPYIFFTQKGNASFPTVETLGTSFSIPISEKINFSGAWFQGRIRSDLIGPANDWGSFHWDYESLDINPNDDQQQVNIYGIGAGGTESLLATTQALDTGLQWIDASLYPFIRLEVEIEDANNRTPTQMDFWRVLYEPVPEAALNPSRFFSFVDDTLDLGTQLSLSIAVENLTDIPMSPMLMKYSVLDPSNREDTSYFRDDSLPGNDYFVADFQYDINDSRFIGQNFLIVEANPDFDQPEYAFFNNVGTIPFTVLSDNINPLLDVTFDGVRIFDGDIVSAKPSVLISLRDENEFLRLVDTNIFQVSVLFPDGNYQLLRDLDPNFVFVPAGADGENLASLELNPEFLVDGEYELVVRDRDMSGNSSTFGEYRIGFEVINESTITNVLNYPNPFTSYTRFVFTLTGSRIPSYFKIQIMTVSGTVIKELTEADLGPINIGRNVTQFGWDGTDKYGDPVANGVYFYRVTTNIDGEKIEQRENNSIDRYFEKGFGKMVLIR